MCNLFLRGENALFFFLRVRRKSDIPISDNGAPGISKVFLTTSVNTRFDKEFHGSGSAFMLHPGSGPRRGFGLKKKKKKTLPV